MSYRAGRRQLSWARHLRMYASKSAPPTGFRPLPEPSVSWRAEDVEEARRVTLLRDMSFREDEAAALPSLQASLKQMRHDRIKIEEEQRHVGAMIPSLAKKVNTNAERVSQLRERARELRTALRCLEKQMDDAHARSLQIRSAWPNRMHPDVPVGPESESRVVAVCDARSPTCRSPSLPTTLLPCTTHAFDASFTSKLQVDPRRDHLGLAQSMSHGGVDMAAGITTTGPSWPYLLGTISMLEHALCQYALHVATRHGFIPVSVPDVIKTDVAERCGFRPRDEVAAQTYFVDTKRSITTDDTSASDDAMATLCLAGTAEIPLAALVAKQTFSHRHTQPNLGGDVASMHLPIRLTALGHAFRAEAGARGADTRGLYRIHQFSKVEMFVVSDAEQSDDMLESLRHVQEDIVNGLGLLYRVVDMSSEELGASAYRKYDIEAWMPGRGAWGEICSASNCTEYQARRLAIKYRDAETGRNTYAHTLNATAAAIPRLLVALIETYSSSNLVLPVALRPFWIGGPSDPRVEWIEPASVAASTPASSGARASPLQQCGTSHPRASFHTSARRNASAFTRAKEQLHSLAVRTGADPAPLLISFVILHEITAIAPIFVLAALLAVLGAGDAMLEWVNTLLNAMMPSENARLYEWIARGRRMATRVCRRFDTLLRGEEGTPMAAAWFTSLTASYVLVKLLLPVRITLSLALSPVTARTLIMPWWRRFRRT